MTDEQAPDERERFTLADWEPPDLTDWEPFTLADWEPIDLTEREPEGPPGKPQ